MAAYTSIDSQSRVVIEHSGPYDRVQTLIVRNADQQEIRVELTDDMLRLLGYTCALHFSKRTNKAAFLPEGFAPPMAFPAHPGGPATPAPEQSRVRVRQIPLPVEQPVPVARTRARLR